MSSINSPLGRRSVASGQPQQRVLSVPDESAPDNFASTNSYAQGAIPTHLQPQMPVNPNLHPNLQQPQSQLDAVQHLRREQLTAANQITQDARNRVNFLAGIGRGSVEVDTEEAVFSLRTLKSKESHAVLRAAAIFVPESPDWYFTMRNMTLARSIYAIDGMPVDMVLGDASPETIQEVVDDMDDLIADRLYSSFLKMQTEQKVKHGLATPSAMKEVAEDVKKS